MPLGKAGIGINSTSDIGKSFRLKLIHMNYVKWELDFEESKFPQKILKYVSPLSR